MEVDGKLAPTYLRARQFSEFWVEGSYRLSISLTSSRKGLCNHHRTTASAPTLEYATNGELDTLNQGNAIS